MSTAHTSTGYTSTGYTSTAVSPGHVAAAIVSGGAVGGLAAVTGPVWLGVLVGVLGAIVGAQLAVVRLVANRDRVAFGWGLWGRLRVLPACDLATVESAVLTRGQVHGLGVRTAPRTTRLTVRPGPALVLRTTSGELVRISTPTPATVVGLLGTNNHAERSER